MYFHDDVMAPLGSLLYYFWSWHFVGVIAAGTPMAELIAAAPCVLEFEC